MKNTNNRLAKWVVILIFAFAMTILGSFILRGQEREITIPETEVEQTIQMMEEQNVMFIVDGVQQIQHEQISDWHYFRQDNWGYFNNDTLILCIGETDYVIACNGSSYEDFQEIDNDLGLLVGYSMLGYNTTTDQNLTIEWWQYLKEPDVIYLALVFNENHLTISYILTDYKKLE